AGADLRAEGILTLDAAVQDVSLSARSHASAGGLGVDPDSIAMAIVNTVATTRIDAGAHVTGVESARILATHQNLFTEARPYSWGGGAAGSADADAYSYHRVLSRIVGADGAVVASKDVDVFARVDTGLPIANARADSPDISLVAENPNNHPEVPRWDRHITWDADTVLLAAPTPELLVNAAGNIVVAKGIVAVDDGTRIVVDDLSNDGNAGRATFRVNPATWTIPIVNLTQGVDGRIDGNLGTLTVRHSWESVDITNLSSKDLVINGIDPFDRTGTAQVRIDADENELHFDIAHDYGPTRIDIANLGVTGTPDIILNGVIDNPLGLTRVVNARGDIRSTATGLVRTNQAVFDAAGSVGTGPTDRLDVDLVQSTGRPTAFDAKAAEDLSLQLRMLDRDPDAAPLTLQLGVLEAGDDVDVVLLPAVQQTNIGTAPTGYAVTVTAFAPTRDASAPGGVPAVVGSYVNHYQVDGSGPAFVVPVGVFGVGNLAVDSLTVFDRIQAGGDIAVVAQFGNTRMDIVATTDLTGEGAVSVHTSGDVTITELLGDLRVGAIVSTQRDVTLTAPASIVDVHGDAQADVSGRRVTLRAQGGSIGSHLNDVEIDSAFSGPGSLLAEAAHDVYLTEVAGSLTVDAVTAGDGHVRLTTRDSAATGEDIIVGEGHAVIALQGSITLQAGDSITIDGQLTAHHRLHFSVDHGNADVGVGGMLALDGTVMGQFIEMFSDDDADLLDASAMVLAVTGWGRRGNDTLRGGSDDDRLYGGDGADEIDGGDGHDLLVADGGVGDVLIGGRGNDTIFGSHDGAEVDPDFGDTVRFGDWIRGGEGHDLIYGLGGADDIEGGAGDDWIDGGLGGDRITGGAGSDTVYGNVGDDRIHGHGSDTTEDDDARDWLYGEWGNDTISGDGGHDVIEGGFGDDHLIGGRGDDVLRAGFGSNRLEGGEGHDQLYGSDDGADHLLGGTGRDQLWGYAGNDTVEGGADDDILDGGAGDDVLSGDAGSDVLVGGADHDTLYGHSVSGAGDDRAVDHLYGDFGTGLNETGSGRDRLFGQGGNDLLFGEGGDDYIEGVAGFVVVEDSGGTGNVIDFGDAGDTRTFVAPVATAAPTPRPVDFTNPRAAPTLPDGADHRGRWGDLGGSAAGDGLSGDAGLSREPVIATGPSGTYVAWVDTRDGNPEIYVARHGVDGWTSLAGSAGNGGISRSATVSLAPSLAVDAAGRPVVAWTEVTAAGRNIRVMRFDAAAAGGAGAWESLGSVTGSSNADDAQLAMTASGPAVVWLEGPADAKRIHARVFAGGAWQELGAGGASGTGIAGAMGGAAGSPAWGDVEDLAVATDGTRIAVAWVQADAAGIRHVYLRELVAGVWTERAGSGSGSGVSGSTDAAYAGTLSNNAQPSLAYQGGSLFAAWQTFSDQGAALSVVEYAGAAAPTVRGTFATPELRSDPVLSAGGDALRLLWVRTPLQAQDTALYAMKWNGSAFVEEVPGDAQGGGLSVTGGRAQALAVVTDSAGRAIVAWQDAINGSPEIVVRGNGNTVQRTFVADAAAG
ncbi:MAG: hypothetical protein KIT73_14025, partial [Burkholderiales bacterium]|nr:hypothetical protein [Burkholderiales bacterium]